MTKVALLELFIITTAKNKHTTIAETSELYQNARDASKRLNAKGLHPNVKAKYNNAILMYKKQLKKICANSISESLYISPIEELFVKLYQLV